MTVREKLFGNLDFKSIRYDQDFKEDSVREVIVLPLINGLGYTQRNIIRSKTFIHPFYKVGSKKRKINLVPDYSIQIDNTFVWILDAKSPKEKIIDDDNVEQVFSYASHPEIRSNYFALCNGIEFSLYRTSGTGKPILFFELENIDGYWDDLVSLISPQSFQMGKEFTYDAIAKNDDNFDYAKRKLLGEIVVKKQSVKRHFGVHGYFTKQTWNVVADYIKNFSNIGDTVLDPFGGSGVTAIESLMNNRKAISIDINPLAVFMVSSLIAPVDLRELNEAFQKIKQKYIKLHPKNDDEISEILTNYPYPKGVKLPKGSDVRTVEELFSKKQLAELALLKSLIKEQKNENIRNTLLLSFSSSINKHNLTFHYTKSEGGGDSGIFRYYRYRIAKEPGYKPLIEIFETKFKKAFAAKKDIEYFINKDTINNANITKASATNLNFIPSESIDYIYTDPPYGKKIPYLDLSVMWNSWLDLEVSNYDYEQEAIQGGEQNKSKDEYKELIEQSIKEMYRVLKNDRWLSFVFAHIDPEFWHLILDTAERCGFEYIGAVPQKNGQTSFKKRQNPFTVLSGQLIINFRKVSNPRAIMKAHLGMDISEIVMQTIEGVIAKNNGATLEQINNELIIKGLELGFLDLLKKDYSNITDVLFDKFDYDKRTGLFTIKINAKFASHIDEKLRIRYYLISILVRSERENKYPHFDEIVLAILPLLKNGTTPESQTILTVLEDIAERVGQDSWKLRTSNQTTLFG
jgi:tRNA G10  N-methylase Trm11